MVTYVQPNCHRAGDLPVVKQGDGYLDLGWPQLKRLCSLEDATQDKLALARAEFEVKQPYQGLLLLENALADCCVIRH